MGGICKKTNQNQEEIDTKNVLDELDKMGVESLQKVLGENMEGTEALAKSMIHTTTDKNDQEKEAMQKLQDDLISIITNGAKSFEEKTGRKMTYAEMRYAYG
jgi:enoyl reductase-like protein